MKDPAFLFYPNDWMGGTLTLNRHQKGCYIDLLVAQFNSGPLSLEDIKTVLGADFAQWPNISKKFTFMDGRYYNPRLEQEKSKRSSFTASRRSNAKAYAQATSEHMEDRDENRDTDSELPIWLNRDAWNAWLKYNAEKKKKLPPSTIEFQLKKLEKFGLENHIAVIMQSIEKGWTGLFPLPDTVQKKQNYKQPPRWIEPSDSKEVNDRKRFLEKQAESLTSGFQVKP